MGRERSLIGIGDDGGRRVGAFWIVDGLPVAVGHRFCTKQSPHPPLRPPTAPTMRHSRNSQVSPPGRDLPRRLARWPRAISVGMGA